MLTTPPTRRLRLRAESFAELTAGELAGVAGGQVITESCRATECSCPASMPLDRCLGDPPTLPPNCYTIPC